MSLTKIYSLSAYLTKIVVVGKEKVPKNYQNFLGFLDKSKDKVEIVVLDDLNVFISFHQLINEGESIHYTTYNKKYFPPLIWYNSDVSEISCSKVMVKDEDDRRAFYLTGCPTGNKFLFAIDLSH